MSDMKIHLLHKWEDVDIKQDVKKVGKNFGEFEKGIQKVIRTITTRQQCLICWKTREQVKVETSISSQY